MEAVPTNLVKEFNREFNELDKYETLNITEVGIRLDRCQDYLERLREYAHSNAFENKEEEIEFFNHLKPQVYGYLKYYLHLQGYFSSKGSGSIQEQRRYIDSQIKKLKKGLRPHQEFMRYCKQDKSNLDKHYFTREPSASLWTVTHQLSCLYDPKFSTSHDELKAKIIAYDLINDFYDYQLNQLRQLEANVCPAGQQEFIEFQMNWTAKKIDLVELVYALHSSRAIKNGNESLRKIAKVLSSVFNTDLVSIYRIYLENEIKKKRPSKIY
ncbi:RteC domain-containing protein [Croceibacter atlanticus]|uniref:RteC domain-containing protein n=1 Tax=Croceibacter atlanticus TaxID=313588 RepID=UPI001C605ECC|nr:RteC domain-containing protein [Croceibacter atlanticus]MBW4970873.1 RteC domain-containing protein [Croceibacter atlanticus]